MSKYTAFDYIDEILIILSATSGGVSIISFTSVVGAPVGIASVSFVLIFFLRTGIIKKLLSITRNKKKKYDKVHILGKSKLNSIETLTISSTGWYGNKSWRRKKIREGERKCEKCKSKTRMRLNSVNSKN